MSDYGEDIVAHFLLSELRAEGHVDQVGRKWMYTTGNLSYEITLRARKVKTRKRLEG